MRKAGIAFTTEGWQPKQVDAASRLQVSGRRLRRCECGILDLTSDEGAASAAAFLRALRSASRALHVELAPRDYRQELSDRVHAAWMDPRCLYSFKVLAISLRGAVFFNGHKYQLSKEAASLSSRLHTRWAEVCGLLSSISNELGEQWDAGEQLRLRQILGLFDQAWAAFERCLFEELGAIEAEARSLVVEAAELFANMDVVGRRHAADVNPHALVHDPEFAHHRRLLVGCVSRLNRLANPRASRRELQIEVLSSAEALIEKYLARPDHPDAPLLPLALDAANAFDDVCIYLYNLPKRMEEVDPHLRNNSYLVQILSTLQATWEVAADFLVSEAGRLTLRGLASSVRHVQNLAPALAKMCEERTAELFLVLPRIALLSSLASPTGLAPLVQTLLPHRLGERGGWGDEGLLSLVATFRMACLQLAEALGTAAALCQRGVESIVVDLLLRSAVSRAGSEIGGLGEGLVASSDASRRALEQCRAFMRTLEGWSLELQRHHAAEWNRFCAILVRCLDCDRQA